MIIAIFHGSENDNFFPYVTAVNVPFTKAYRILGWCRNTISETWKIIHSFRSYMVIRILCATNYGGRFNLL